MNNGTPQITPDLGPDADPTAQVQVTMPPQVTNPDSDPGGFDSTVLQHDLGSRLEPGVMLGDYRILGQLGEGGMGVVYSAIHPRIGKRAAIKVLKKQLCSDPAAIERFVNEARAVNEIGHPSIVDIFTFGETLDGRSYLVMEWLKGRTLRDRIAHEMLGVLEICTIVRTLARAVEAAHDKGVIHRDLKPENIFLVEVKGEVSRVKLLDFGIAKLARVEDSVERTATGEMIGTPTYISPEQARGRDIDGRADIYSLGGIMFELLTGRTPFLAETAMDMVAKHLLDDPPWPSAFAPEIPPELDHIVHAMLAKNPDERPTLARLCAVLDATVKPPRPPSEPITLLSQPVVLLPTLSLPNVVPVAPVELAPPRPHRARIAAGALAVLTLVAVIIGVVRGRGDDEAAPPPAPVASPSASAPVVVTSDAAVARVADPPADASRAAVAPVAPVTPATGVRHEPIKVAVPDRPRARQTIKPAVKLEPSVVLSPLPKQSPPPSPPPSSPDADHMLFHAGDFKATNPK